MKYRASRAAAMGLLFALSIVLSFAESALIPPLPGARAAGRMCKLGADYRGNVCRKRG